MAQLQQDGVRNRLLEALSPDRFGRLRPSLHLTDLPLQQMLIVTNERVEHLCVLEGGGRVPRDEVEIPVRGLVRG